MQRAELKMVGAPAAGTAGRPSKHGNAQSILAESRDSANPDRSGTLGVAQEIQARRLALAELLDQYGDAHIPERVYRARGLGFKRGRKSRRQSVRENTVLKVIKRLDRERIDYTCADLAQLLGQHNPGAAQRIRGAVKLLIAQGRCEPGTAGVGRQQ